MSVLAENRFTLALPAVITAVAFFGVFHDKAFTIDDPYFLLQAKHVLSDPWHPSSFDIAWNNLYGRASQLSPSGPMMAYLLVPTVLAEGAEWVAHLTVTAFLCWSAYSMVGIARWLNFSPKEAAAAALILVATPTVIAMGSTAMPDIPGLAFGLAGVERWLAFQLHHKWHQMILAIVFLSLAVLTRSHAAGLIGICVLAAALPIFKTGSTRVVRCVRVLPLAVVPAAVLLVSWLTRDIEAQTTNLAQTVSFLNRKYAADNLLAFCGHFTMALPFAVPWLVMRGKQILNGLVLGAVLIVMLLCWMNAVPWWAYVLAVPGAAALADVFCAAWQRRDPLQLIFGLWLLIALPICFYVHMPSKYLVLSVPAMGLLLILQSRRSSAAVRKAGLGIWLIGALGIGFLIIDADAERTDLGRRAARRFIAAAPRGVTIWYGGHWGFQWYAEQAGARSLVISSSRPHTGDFIVCSDTWAAQSAKYHCRILSSVVGGGPGCRVMCNGAGFYSNVWGYLPLSWGSGTYESFSLMVVTDESTRW